MSTDSEIEKELFDSIRLKDEDRFLRALSMSENAEILLSERWDGRCSPLHFAAFMGWQDMALRIVVQFPVLGELEDEAGQTPFAIAKARGFEELALGLRNSAFPETYGYKRKPDSDLS